MCVDQRRAASSEEAARAERTNRNEAAMSCSIWRRIVSWSCHRRRPRAIASADSVHARDRAAAHVEANEIALGVAAVEPSVCERGRRPAFAAENLGPSDRFERIRRRVSDDEFTFITLND